MKSKRQHFVPQHYLRQFRAAGTKQVVTSKVVPYSFIGLAAINRQCQEDYFYGADGTVDQILLQSETDIAPVLVRVTETRAFDAKELVALCFLAAVLHARTRKAVEATKVFPKHIADEVIKNAIKRGDLRQPEGGYQDGTMDFRGVPGFLIGTSVIPCWLEMQTLQCKLLEADSATQFITSDDPVVILNQLFATERHRSLVGFSRSGFQLLLPISPRLALFFYDSSVYKVGSRRDRVVQVTKDDVEIINSLQIQSAERCLYFYDVAFEPEVRRLVMRYSGFRRPLGDLLRLSPGRKDNETLVRVRRPSVKLPKPWRFCRYLRNVHIGPDNRRNAAWTTLVKAVAEDMHEDPSGGDLFERMERILGCSLRDSAMVPDNLVKLP
jgi:hypothetical protein